jgi:hypothetical protein
VHLTDYSFPCCAGIFFTAEKMRYAAIRGEPLRIAAYLIFSAVKIHSTIGELQSDYPPISIFIHY